MRAQGTGERLSIRHNRETQSPGSAPRRSRARSRRGERRHAVGKWTTLLLFTVLALAAVQAPVGQARGAHERSPEEEAAAVSQPGSRSGRTRRTGRRSEGRTRGRTERRACRTAGGSGRRTLGAERHQAAGTRQRRILVCAGELAVLAISRGEQHGQARGHRQERRNGRNPEVPWGVHLRRRTRRSDHAAQPAAGVLQSRRLGEMERQRAERLVRHPRPADLRTHARLLDRKAPAHRPRRIHGVDTARRGR